MQKHYTPALSRFNVCALYHEAHRRGIPMTKLTDEIVSAALRGTLGWQQATEAMEAQEQSIHYKTNNPAQH
jgi:hypothetical protein